MPPIESDRLAVRTRPVGHIPVMHQRWQDLLFLHWSYDPSAIQSTLPEGLTIDTFDGKAWVGIVPFFMRDVRPSFCPPLPGISYFLEMNVRTYVYDQRGVPGVWFYSLDANQRLAVLAARRLFHLPYFESKMKADRDPKTSEIRYMSHRRGTQDRLISRFRYRPRGSPRLAQPGTLEFFLIERYVLFTVLARQLCPWSCRVHHQPYPLMDVEVSEWDDASLALAGLKRNARGADHSVMSSGVAVEVFALTDEARPEQGVDTSQP